MAILNLGSINVDHVYSVGALPQPGETIAAKSLHSGLGGKGANQSIAAAKAGAELRHLGAVGPDADWTLDALQDAGVDITLVARTDVPTGHAIITVDDAAENAIVLFKGANHQIRKGQIDAALGTADAGDWLLLQNETNLTDYAAKQARAAGMRVAYCAAPFDADAVRRILPHVDLLSVNQIEAAQLRSALADQSDELDRITWLTTFGAKGATYQNPQGSVHADAYSVSAIDTTGAGDTFLGYALAGIDAGLDISTALTRASAAAAIQVTRPGAAAAIPTLSEVLTFIQKAKI